METKGYRNPGDEEAIRWWIQALVWSRVDARLVPSLSAVIWMDQGIPWAVFHAEEVVYNLDVAGRLRATVS